MAWFNDAKFVESKKVCDCEDGKFPIQIINIETDTTDYGLVLNVYLGIDSKSWNAIPYKHSIYQGEYFDDKFSRLCECFNVDFEKALAGGAKNDFSIFLNTTGIAEFSHEKKKRVQEGFKPDGKPNFRYETEKTEFVQARLIPAAKAQNSTYAALTKQPQAEQKNTQTIQQLTTADEKAMNAVFGEGSKSLIY